jgi:hypothetical protein
MNTLHLKSYLGDAVEHLEARGLQHVLDGRRMRGAVVKALEACDELPDRDLPRGRGEGGICCFSS